VPKLAATLASLLMIASSIGVNIARYPRVGHSIDPQVGRTNDHGQADVAPAEPAQAANPEPITLPPPPVETAQAVPPTKANESASNGEAKQQSGMVTPVTVPIIDVRPMAPAANSQTDSGNSPAADDQVQRLPPVETNGFTMQDAEPASPNDSASYPTTATP